MQATSPSRGTAYSIVVALVLIGFEMVWLFLIAVQVFLRGPNWNVFWPGERWDAHRVVPLNNVNFSEYFWLGWIGRPAEGMPWVLRELPGLALLGGYFLAGSAIAYGLFRLAHRETPYWRWVALVLLVQFAALVPIKMVARWTFNLKYLIYIPEHFWNI
jgi:hypothetical protein